MRYDDLIISLAYFSVPTSLTISLIRYSRIHVITSIPRNLLVLGILINCLFLFCGIGHLLRSTELMDTTAFQVVNSINAIFSVLAVGCLIPMAPTLITNAEKSYQDLVDLNEETAASKRKLFTFMNFLCHEIRNPLFAITSNIEFAQDMPMTHDLYESLTGINQSAQLMLRLVNDVLDLSKIESGKLQLEPQLFNLQEFFQNMATTMDRQVRGKHQGQVHFVFSMAPEIPRMVQADSTRLLQICYNVLSNSNKFTERGSISFHIKLLQGDASHKTLSSSQTSLNNNNGNSNNNTNTNETTEVSDPDLNNGMASLENFSFSALAGGPSSLTKSRQQQQHQHQQSHTNKSTAEVVASSSMSSLGRLQNKLLKTFPSTSLRSLGSASDLSMDGVSENPGSTAHPDPSKKDATTTNAELDDEDAFDTVMLQLVFEDTGIGIEEEHLGRIFQPYTQSKLSDFRRHGGTGLGLSIIHKLLEMMQGTVDVTSKIGEGTKFIIHLPIKVAKEEASRNAGGGGDPIVDIESTPVFHSSMGGYATLEDNPATMELELDLPDEVEKLESVDYVTPLSSASSHNQMLSRIKSAARTYNNISGGATTSSGESSVETPLSSASSCDFMVSRITNGGGGGAVNMMMDFIPPDRDGAATPITGNGTIGLKRQYSGDHRSLPRLSGGDPKSLPRLHMNAPPPLPSSSRENNSHSPVPLPPPVGAEQPIESLPKNSDAETTVAAAARSLPNHDNTRRQPSLRLSNSSQMANSSQMDSSDATILQSNNQISKRLNDGSSGDAAAASSAGQGTPAATTTEASSSKNKNQSALFIIPQKEHTEDLSRASTPPRQNQGARGGGGGGLFAVVAPTPAPSTPPSNLSVVPTGGLFAMTAPSAAVPFTPLTGNQAGSGIVVPTALPPGSTTVYQSSGGMMEPKTIQQPPKPLPPVSVVPGQHRVRQLAKFNFPKNTNMVLLVDDNGVNRKLLGKMLTYFNLQYQDAEHGKQAVEIMERSQNFTGDTSAPQFGLVLMDLCMPVMDGYEAIRQLRNKLNLHKVPIVALTASAMEDEKQKAMAAGATEFATKPLLRPALHKKCLEYLQ